MTHASRVSEHPIRRQVEPKGADPARSVGHPVDQRLVRMDGESQIDERRSGIEFRAILKPETPNSSGASSADHAVAQARDYQVVRHRGQGELVRSHPALEVEIRDEALVEPRRRRVIRLAKECETERTRL